MNIKNKLFLISLSVFLISCAEPAIDAPSKSTDASASLQSDESQIFLTQNEPLTSYNSVLAGSTNAAYNTITAANDIPTVSNELFFVAENHILDNISLLANDTDINGDYLSIIGFSNSQAGGTVEQIQVDKFKYIAPFNFNGLDSFTYLVSDGHGGQAYGKAEIVVYSLPNLDIIAKADSFNVIQNTPINLNLVQNDVVNSTNFSAISISSYPIHGTVLLNNNGTAQYTPASNYAGPDSFTYQLKDLQNNLSIASVSLNIECITNCSRTFLLNWKPSSSPGMMQYRLYIGRQYGIYTEVIQTGQMTQYEYIVKDKGIYYFAVTSVNSSNIESNKSGVVWGVF